MMKFPLFSSDFFVSNRQRLKQRLNTDMPIVVTASGLLQRGADSSYPFTQDANFWYLTGIPDPDITLIMEGDREFLIVPIREGARVTFDGQIDNQALSSISGITDIINEASGWKRLDGMLEKSGRLATLAPAPMYIEQLGMYANPARSRLMERLGRHVSELELTDIRTELATLRMIKQTEEIKAIQAAIDITCLSLKEVMAKPPGSYEYEYQIEADLSRGFRFSGGQGHAFEPIVAGGVRACTLHNVTNSGRLRQGELVVIDVGASVEGYAADITRVYANGQPTKRQKDVFKAVKDVQAYALELLKPGVSLKSYEGKVVKFIGQQLKQLGLITNQKEESIREYFPHATSHFLGLNVHDVGDYQQQLKPGTVLTVEPGIYIPKEGIGVRIEDDVLITETGHKLLSNRLPAKL
jgi:Xaa-Pro aminopeptidase